MEGTWRTEEVTEGGVTSQADNDTDAVTCVANYIPTVREYREAMGVYQTVLLAVGGSITLLLYVLYATQVHYTLQNVNKPFRRHVLWITFACPFMTLMSVVSVVVPRADTTCTAFKTIFLSLSMTHFMDLTTALFGNAKIMLADLSNQQFNLKVGPSCYCCFCFPSPPVTEDRLRWVRWLLWQMPYTQAFFFGWRIIWSISLSDSQGRLDPNFNFIWIIVLSFVTAMAGIYGLQIISALCREHLDDYGYQNKSFSLKFLVIATQLQSFVLDLLSLFNVFPCVSPHISPRVFKLTVENTLYLPEMLIIGVFTWRTYRNLQLQTRNIKEKTSDFTTVETGSNATNANSTISTCHSSSLHPSDLSPHSSSSSSSSASPS